MRTKRILSLVLAIAMLASLTISASATQSEIYYVQKFDYNDNPAAETTAVDALLADFAEQKQIGSTTPTKYGGSVTFETDDEGNPTNVIKALSSSKALEGGTSGDNGIAIPYMWSKANSLSKRMFLYTTTAGTLSKNRSTIAVNANGNKAFNPYGQITADSYSDIYFVPKASWNAVANNDETFVLAYEISSAKTEATGKVANASKDTVVFSAVADDATHYSHGTLYTAYTYSGDNILDYVNYSSKKLTNNEVHEVVVAFSKNASNDYLSFQKYFDGVADGSLSSPKVTSRVMDATGTYTGTTVSYNATTVEMIKMSFRTGWQLSIADMKMYTLKNAAGAFNVARTTGGVVSTTVGTIPVKFSQPVEPTSYDADAVTITGTNETGTVTLYNGTDFEVSDVTEVIEGEEIYSTAEIVFLTELAEATEYTITFPGVKNTIAKPLDGYNTITFSTPTPDVKIASFNIVNAWGTESEAVSANDYFLANNTLQAAAIALKNNTEDDKNIAVIYAVYANSGKLVDVVYANDVLEDSATTDIYAGVTLSEEGKVKAFVWDGISSLKPHTGATEKDIRAVVE